MERTLDQVIEALQRLRDHQHHFPAVTLRQAKDTLEEAADDLQRIARRLSL